MFFYLQINVFNIYVSSLFDPTLLMWIIFCHSNLLRNMRKAYCNGAFGRFVGLSVLSKSDEYKII